MTAIPLDPTNALDNRERLVRGALFLATFLQVCLTAVPFPDLSDPALLDPAASAGNLASQLLTLLITGSLALFAFVKRLNLVLTAVTPALVLTLAWFAFSALFSAHPDLALRRLALAGFTIFQAAVFVLLPLDREHFAKLLATGALIVLLLCFAGVLLAPEHSTHTAHDIAEPELAGDWRGFFTHKNGAGAAMVLFIFFGIFIIRSASAGLGALVIALAAVFLAFTRSKSPINLLPVVLFFAIVVARLRTSALRYAVAASIPLIIGVLTIGSVAIDSVHAFVYKFLPDPTFTGRNEIWEFALDHIAQRPLVGFGYQAFWGTSELVSDWNYLESWGYRASDAHNGFLNIAVMTGVTGLALTLIYVFFRPLRDYGRTPGERIDPALTMLFLQLLLFDLYLCGFESELFNNGSLVWFMALVAIIGLRFQATSEYAPGSA
jgi:O-antigen ligase